MTACLGGICVVALFATTRDATRPSQHVQHARWRCVQAGSFGCKAQEKRDFPQSLSAFVVSHCDRNHGDTRVALQRDSAIYEPPLKGGDDKWRMKYSREFRSPRK